MSYQYKVHSVHSCTDQSGQHTLRATVAMPQGDQHLHFEIQSSRPVHLNFAAKYEPFVLALLIPAMEAGCDLIVDGAIDETLLFNLNSQVIPFLRTQYEYLKPIRVIASTLKSTVFVPDDRLTLLGMSCGLDALAAFADLTADQVPERFRPRALLFSDIGAFGKGRDKYIHDRGLVTAFAKSQNMPLFYLSSNMGDFHRNNYTQSYSLRNAAAAWALQPIAKTATYASGVVYKALSSLGHKSSIGSAEPILFPMLTTPQFEVYASGYQHTRTDKLREVLRHKPLLPFLNPCLRSVKRKGGYVNCGTCKKCAEIIFRASAFGKLDEIQSTFNLAAFEEQLFFLTFKLAYNAHKKNSSEGSHDTLEQVKHRPDCHIRSARILGTMAGRLTHLA